MNNIISWLKKNIGIAIILLTFVIVIISGLKSGLLPQAIDSIVKADPFYLFLAVLCFFVHILFNSIANKSFINRQGYGMSLKEAFRSSMAGFYYSSITPAGTGGFPIQIYYLSKNGVPVGVASSAVTCFMNVWFFVRLLLVTVFILLRKDMLLNIFGNNIVFLNIGYAYNIYIILFFLVLGFVKKPVTFLINSLDKMIRKFKLLKDPESFRIKLTETAERYHDAMQKTLLYPAEIFRQLVYCCIYVISINSIIYFAYRSLGLSGASYFDLLGLSLCQAISAAYMPTPGGAGGQELIFSLFFSTIIKENYLLAVMLIWRFISFYFGLIFGAIYTSLISIKNTQ